MGEQSARRTLTPTDSNEEALVLSPIDSTANKSRARTGNKPIVDFVTQLDNQTIRAQLNNYSDTVCSRAQAPFNKKKMMWKGEVTRLFSLPAQPLWNARLLKLYTRCLVLPVPDQLRKRRKGCEADSLDDFLRNLTVPEDGRKERHTDQEYTEELSSLQPSVEEESINIRDESIIPLPLPQQGFKHRAQHTEPALSVMEKTMDGLHLSLRHTVISEALLAWF